MFKRILKKIGFPRILLSPEKALGTPASRVINEILSLSAGSKSYLEIGVEHGYTFEAVVATHKTGVDPNFRFSKRILSRNITLDESKSDDFFRKAELNDKFDLIFIDGLHTAEQTWRDFVNSTSHLVSGGVIIIDDTVPNDRYSAEIDYEITYKKRRDAGIYDDYRWHGDVYRVIMKIVSTYPQIRIATLEDQPNPFTICWNIPNSIDVSDTFIPQINFSELFEDGIPKEFNPIGFSEFLKLLKE